MRNKPLQLLGLALVAALAVLGVSCAAVAQDTPLTAATPATTEAPTSGIPTVMLPTDTPQPTANSTPLSLAAPSSTPGATAAAPGVTERATAAAAQESSATAAPAATTAVAIASAGATAAPEGTATSLPTELPVTGADGILNALVGLLPLLALLLLAIPAVVGWKSGQK